MTLDDVANLFQQHRPAVTRYVCKVYTYVDHETMDGLYSDLWVAFSQVNFIDQKHMKTYLIEALQNRVKNLLRDRMRSDDVMDRLPTLSLSEPVTLDAADKQSFVDKANEPIDLTLQDSDLRYQAIMSGLPPTLRVVAEMYFVDDCTQEEIACHFNVHRLKIQRMIQRAKALLKQRYTYYNKASARGLL